MKTHTKIQNVLKVSATTALFATGLLFANSGFAATRCEKVQPMLGCIHNFAEIAKEQVKVDKEDPSIKLRPSIEAIFGPVNHKLLMLKIVRRTLQIDYDANGIQTTYQGKKTENVKICFEACPGEGTATWYHDEHGVFKAIPGGLSVNGYKFMIQK